MNLKNKIRPFSASKLTMLWTVIFGIIGYGAIVELWLGHWEMVPVAFLCALFWFWAVE